MLKLFHVIRVDAYERAILMVDGVPERYLFPGRHVVWAPFSDVWAKRLMLKDTLVVDLTAEEAALVSPKEFSEVEVGPLERVVLWKKGRPVKWLGEGRHYVYLADPSVRVTSVDASVVEAVPLPKAVRLLAPAVDYVDTVVPAGSVAVRYVDGVLDAVLGPGLHAAFSVAHEVKFAVIEMRERLLPVNGQEVLTRDRVTLRLNASAAVKVKDAKVFAEASENPMAQLYLAVQMAVRESVASRTLDELLEARDALAGEVFQAVSDEAQRFGMVLCRLGLKDVVLPGEMRALLNKVVEAKKEAEANIILRREEAAATRALAQTAKLLAEEPVLMRLKELEALKDMANKVGDIKLVLGENALEKLHLRV